MSALKYPQLEEFYRWMRARDWTQEKLAGEAGCGRSHLALVLTGKRPGHHTWRRVVRVIPAEAVSLLKLCPSWNTHAEAAWRERQAREKLEATWGGAVSMREEASA